MNCQRSVVPAQLKRVGGSSMLPGETLQRTCRSLEVGDVGLLIDYFIQLQVESEPRTLACWNCQNCDLLSIYVHRLVIMTVRPHSVSDTAIGRRSVAIAMHRACSSQSAQNSMVTTQAQPHRFNTSFISAF